MKPKHSTSLRKRTLQIALMACALLWSIPSLKAQLCFNQDVPQKMWSQSYEGWIANDVLEYDGPSNSPKGYMMAGSNSISNSGNQGYPMLMRVDLDGAVQDAMVYDLTSFSDQRAYALVQVKDGDDQPDGYAFVSALAQPSPLNQGGEEAFLVRVREDLTIDWVQEFDGNRDEAFTDLIVDAAGNFVLLGHTDSKGHGGYDIQVTKISTNGQLIWNNTYGGLKDEFGYGIIEDRDGGYAICGTHKPSNKSELLVLRIEDNGNQTFMKSYGNNVETPFVEGYAILERADGYAITGMSSESSSFVKVLPFLVKVDNNGTYESGHRYYYPNGTGSHNGIGIGLESVQVSASCPEEFLIVGAMDQEGMALQTDGPSVRAWRQILNPNPTQAGFDAIYNNSINAHGLTKGKGLIMAGHANDQIWLVKTGTYGRRNGCLTGNVPAPLVEDLFTIAFETDFTLAPLTGLNPVSPMITFYAELMVEREIHCQLDPDRRFKTIQGGGAGFQVYPNPSQGRFQIEWTGEAAEALEVEIFSLSGKLVHQVEFSSAAWTEVDLSELPKGLYLVRTNQGHSTRITLQ